MHLFVSLPVAVLSGVLSFVSIFSPSFKRCVSVTSLLVQCCLEEETCSRFLTYTHTGLRGFFALFQWAKCNNCDLDLKWCLCTDLWSVPRSVVTRNNPQKVHTEHETNTQRNRKRQNHTKTPQILWKDNNIPSSCWWSQDGADSFSSFLSCAPLGGWWDLYWFQL